MLHTIVRVWRARRHQAEIASLADRLGPHIARDIGIIDAAKHANPPVLPPL